MKAFFIFKNREIDDWNDEERSLRVKVVKDDDK